MFPAERQTEILANYIMGNIPDEPCESEGAGECAVRLLIKYREALNRIANELSFHDPDEDYPAPVVNACGIARKALKERT